MSRTWYEGTADPLDSTVDVGPDNNFAEWFPGGEQAPEQILVACEEADEAEGCQCGAHLEEYIKSRCTLPKPRSRAP